MPDLIKNILPAVMGKLSSGNPEWQNSLTRAWEAIVENKAKRHTAIAGLRKGRLLVNVDSPVWVFQLSFKKAELLKRLQKDFPELSGLGFRIGNIH